MNLIGKKFGRLTVTGFEGIRTVGIETSTKARFWQCTCECGNVSIVRTALLNNGSTNSCGCLRIERAIESNTKHDKSKTREYKIWISLVQRCTNPKARGYDKYSLLPHDVRWFENFDNFSDDMSDTYFDGATIDRIDNEKGYSKENCRWVTPAVQSRNKKISDANTSGATGVSWSRTERDTYASAFWREGDRKVSKSFSVKKYGLLESFALAVKYRKEQIERLNKLGYGYTDTHGQ